MSSIRKKKTNLTDALGHQVTDKRLDILRRIGTAGSISEAARGAGVSYKAAWQALETLSNLAGSALVEKVVGGAGGGGARLTAAGQQLLRASEQMQTARAALMQTLDKEASEDKAQMPALSALGLRTSMRNQLPCTIKALKKQGASLRVELGLADGTSLFSRITRESAELLGLAPGLPVLALCKATAVSIARSWDQGPGYNVLHGIVSRASLRGEEVVLQLTGGMQLVGFVASGHGLKPGLTAMASLEEASVVIALAV